MPCVLTLQVPGPATAEGLYKLMNSVAAICQSGTLYSPAGALNWLLWRPPVKSNAEQQCVWEQNCCACAQRGGQA